MFKKLYLLLALGAILLTACTGGTTEPNQPFQGFEFAIKLTDSAQQELVGYKIGLVPQIDTRFTGRPTTIFSYSLDHESEVALEIQDYFGKHVETLENSVKPAGRYSINWNASSLDGEIIPDGIYQFVKKEIVNNQVVSTNKQSFSKFAYFSLPHSPYKTNNNGYCIFDSVLPFPSLYCTDEFETIDENGVLIDTYKYSNKMRVEACPTDADGVALTNQTRCATITIDNSYNIKLNWDEMEPVTN